MQGRGAQGRERIENIMRFLIENWRSKKCEAGRKKQNARDTTRLREKHKERRRKIGTLKSARYGKMRNAGHRVR